ncbi:MAG: PEGA domain-containing protein [Gracilimonas sp.]|nr:PEGA domain-containing protein [Gracilimonas sp.]
MYCGTPVHKTAFSLFIVFILLCSTKTLAQQTDIKDAWIKVLPQLEEFYIVVDRDFENAHLVNRGDSVKVNPGDRHITLVWRTINDHQFTTDIEAGETTERSVYHSFPTNPKSSYQAIANQTNLFITTDENSTVYINDRRYGKHMVQTFLNPGTYQLRIEHPELGTLRKKIKVNSLNVTEVARFNENPSKLSFATKLLPGAEYIASRRYKRAVFTYVGLGLLTTNLIWQNQLYSDKLDEFNEFKSLYKNAQSSQDAIKYRRNTVKAEETLNQIVANFNISLLLAGILYTLTTFDSFRKPKSGYRYSSKYLNNSVSFSTRIINSSTPFLFSLKIAFD